MKNRYIAIVVFLLVIVYVSCVYVLFHISAFEGTVVEKDETKITVVITDNFRSCLMLELYGHYINSPTNYSAHDGGFAVIAAEDILESKYEKLKVGDIIRVWYYFKLRMTPVTYDPFSVPNCIQMNILSD